MAQLGQISQPTPDLRRVTVTFQEFIYQGGQVKAVFKIEDRAGIGKDALPQPSLVVPVDAGALSKLTDPRPVESIFLTNGPYGGFGTSQLVRVDWWYFPYDATLFGVEPWFGHANGLDGVIEYVVVFGKSQIVPSAWVSQVNAGGGAFSGTADNGAGGVFTIGGLPGFLDQWDDNLLYGRNLDFLWKKTFDPGGAAGDSAAPASGRAFLSGPNVWRHIQNDEHNSAGSVITWPNESYGGGGIRIKKGDLVALRTWCGATNGTFIGTSAVQSGVHLYYQRAG